MRYEGDAEGKALSRARGVCGDTDRPLVFGFNSFSLASPSELGSRPSDLLQIVHQAVLCVEGFGG